MKIDLAGLGGEWRTTVRAEGVVTGGGYGSKMGTVTEGEIDTQYRYQPQPDFRAKEESDNIIRT